MSNDDIKAIGAGATTLGVLLALFGPPVRRWWRSPLLSLEYDPNRDAPHWDRVMVNDEAFFLRLRVRNARGCDAAEEVQALVTEYQAVALGHEGRALEWSGQRDRHDPRVTTLRVPPGLQRHVDLMQITPWPPQDRKQPPIDAASGTDPPSFYARLCVYPKPWGSGHLVPPTGAHHIVVTVTAANSDGIAYKMTISHDGELSASQLGQPKRMHRRGLFALLKSFLRLALAGSRPAKV